MLNPDILLVKPGSQRQIYSHLSDSGLTAIEPPLWSALLAAFFRDQGWRVEILDAEILRLSWEQTALEIAQLHPRLVVIMVSGSNPSASTMNMAGAGEILRLLKKSSPEIPTALWGLHPSALPERTLREEAADFVVQGEGFHTLPALLTALRDGQTLKGIPGLWRREGGIPVAGSLAPVWTDLDTLPRPAWEMLPITAYRAHNWHCLGHLANRQPYAVLYTSMGCPFHCSFCCVNSLFGGPGLRCRDVSKVIEEVDFLVESFGVRHIKIIDEMFAFDEARVVRLCQQIADRGYDLNMWAYGRVNTVTGRMLGAMKKAGINWIAYGFESASARVLKDVSKGYQPRQVENVVRLTEQEGLHINANFIFGLPEDDMASLGATLDLACQINAAWANFYPALAFPGSALFERAQQENWPLPKSWSGYSPYSKETLPLPTKYLSGPEVLAFRDRAFHAYFQRPEYLAKIRATFGQEALEHIIAMTEMPLVREHVPAQGDSALRTRAVEACSAAEPTVDLGVRA